MHACSSRRRCQQHLCWPCCHGVATAVPMGHPCRAKDLDAPQASRTAFSDLLRSTGTRGCTQFVHGTGMRDGYSRAPPRGTTVAERNLMSEAALRILLVDQNVTRASILEEALREAGYTTVTVVRDMQNLLRRIVDADPDVICIDLENPNRDVLEQMFQVSRVVRRPVAMFVDRSDSDMIKAAVEAGVGAYVVDGLKKERVKSVVDMAVNRFKAFNDLRDELDRARQALDERKVIERAKGILMKERNLTEDDAYALLRKAAMSDNKRVVEIAQAVITAAGLLR
jgi:two-component system, response regulator / RNA-binding antiterminator